MELRAGEGDEGSFATVLDSRLWLGQAAVVQRQGEEAHDHPAVRQQDEALLDHWPLEPSIRLPSAPAPAADCSRMQH